MEFLTELGQNIDTALQDKTTSMFVTLFLTLYAGLAAPGLPDSVVGFFDTIVGKVIFLFLIGFVGSRNVEVALMIAVAFVVTLHIANKRTTEKYINFLKRERFMNYEHFEDKKEKEDDKEKKEKKEKKEDDKEKKEKKEKFEDYSEDFEGEDDEDFEDGPNEEFEDGPTEEFGEDPTEEFTNYRENFEDGPNEEFGEGPTEEFDPTEEFEDPNEEFGPGPVEGFENGPNEEFGEDPTEEFEGADPTEEFHNSIEGFNVVPANNLKGESKEMFAPVNFN
jgi:hypothetical protein